MNLQGVLLDVKQMTEADRLTVASGIPVSELMFNAGKAVALAIEQRWSARPVVVLCGPGNNGGDGFVVAQLLAEKGWPIDLALLGCREQLTGAARFHAELWQGVIKAISPEILNGVELVVDAIFGAGLSRPFEGVAAETLAVAAIKDIPIVAIDVPSGVMGDSGEALGSVAAALTVTFFCKKPGHVLAPGRIFCGEIVVADIGITNNVLEFLAPNTYENNNSLWVCALPLAKEDALPQYGLPRVFAGETIAVFQNNLSVLKQAIVGPCILILQEDELLRLFNLSGDKLFTTRTAARQSGAIILLKGEDVLITAPDGRIIIDSTLPTAFCTAEYDEVIVDILHGLFATGMEPFLAAAATLGLLSTAAKQLGPRAMVVELANLVPSLLLRLQKLNHY
jgi:hydroxyethylthiazole kinase-like uncharacterized protein yjeF